jgi:hypothetical protein
MEPQALLPKWQWTPNQILFANFDGYSGVSPLEAGNTADIKQKNREEIQ